MKNFKILVLLVIAAIGFNSCQEDDDLQFVAQTPGEFMFSNSFLEEYVLTPEASGNIAERFTWDNANFEVPTNTTYELQRSLTGDFTDMVVVESTTANEIAVTIGQMLTFAEEAGLNNDPATPELNSGTITFRLRAFIGDTGNGTEILSMAQALNVVLPPASTGGTGGGIELAVWGVVGSGYNDWGNAGPDGAFYTTDQAGVIVSYVTLVDGQIKFRTDNDWSSGDDLGDAGNDGILDQDPDNNINVTAGDYKITIDTNDNSYTIEPFSWGIVGSGYNNWGADGPDAKFYYDYTTDTFKVSAQLVDGEIKVRSNNDWSSGDDLGDAGNDGMLDQDADNNIPVTAGHYTMTIDFNTNNYTLVEDTVWGIVGSGYNNWGGDGPDFALTQVQPNIYVGDVATLIAGEIKFRTNNDWGSGDDLGDAGNDGILDQDSDNNIAVEAGLYRVRINFSDNSYQLNKVQ